MKKKLFAVSIVMQRGALITSTPFVTAAKDEGEAENNALEWSKKNRGGFDTFECSVIEIPSTLIARYYKG